MVNIQVKDAQGDVVDVAANGTGTEGDPHVPRHVVDSITALPGAYTEAATTDPAVGLVVLHRTASRGLRAASSTDPLNVDGGSPVVAAASDALAADTFRSAALSNTAVPAKTSSGTVYGYHIANPGASAAWCHLYDVASGSVVVGTTTPKLSLFIPAGACLDAPSVVPGIAFAPAITAAATTTAAGGTAPSTALTMNLVIK